ncbi:aspartate-semialdehyde dehydrogenase [Helicobacter winghamensis]|uniref:Aspartate-semialdehyde dehydrogenase n=1 Tax=Helicobacter winghamensis TaxID=157268 RepID=A0A2N3PKH7_9HELI|nr:aspartate-semialdehyde dehydrogenase [Helicobacter winghamensis]EEO25979.1 aspartate-semialdehyde dehydrogenase [Helicobacter winghamensis ATCC BAA-430]PKT76990.1 aspartate-semialdehyde dehydrogenase [Helicobacter winghamensis]PKT77130.1 aspartate-semialdehyde dehydrogenase [Helicobacter winghamensis]PKT77690.1 aspartate-semialdehyde dehydrogenase [Helicobacter winghamensis]PKT81928.1 aspartate-semialdehyde dehydrogenase [Helicobacter winghamensis]
MKKYNIAVVGATGAVGEEIFRILEERNLPLNKLVPLASARSVGREIEFKGEKYKVKELTHSVFDEENIEIAFFSAGGSVSAEFASSAAKAGAVVIDNTSHFRMQKDVPLVVPEVNPNDILLWEKTGIIANPNCSTIQMVQVLAPLHEKFGIERVDVSTYQAVSGAGKKGMEELVMQMQKFFDFSLDSCEPKAFPHRIALNLIPQIDVFMDNDYTKEEMKMVNETNKIMHSDFAVSATCVRVPVLRSHSEAITIKFKQEVSKEDAQEVLRNAESVVLLDDPQAKEYPMPMIATDTDETYVGRIRVDNYDKSILHLWCVADQIRVGAATNAVRIAEKWIGMQV